MSLPFFIARRYLFSKKKHNAINIISGISVCGVALATLALVCTLSVFNGFQDMVAGFFTAFDPELKITAREGKVFDPHEACIRQVHALSEIDVWTETLEENAMVQYKDRQAMAVIKGVEDNFEQLTSIDSLLYGTGKFLLSDSVVDYGFLGVELISELGTGIQFVDPLQVYAPKRNVRVNIANPTAAFNREYLFSPGAIFAVNQQKYDSRYILTSLDFARRLFNYDTEVSAIEMKLKPGSNIGSVQKKIAGILGDRFIVQNRYEQQADVFRIMEIEKLISYLFLTFILGIACFNVIGSLSMLILDKREDVKTLRNLGADDRLIARIFLFEGRMISVFGALSGIVLGLLLCFLQQRFGLISLGGGNGSFVVDAYPVSVHATDIILVFLTVITVGFLSVWYPVRYLSKRLLRKDKKQLLLTDNRQSVTQGKNDFLHTRIPRHQIIEGFDTDCLQVCAMGVFFQHMAIPQGIVGNDISTAGKAGEHHFIILYVFTLISVNKGKVESEVQLRYQLQSITDVEPDFIRVIGILQPRTGEVLLLVVDFKRMQHPALWQSFCYAKCGISAISPYLQHLPGTNHPDKHLEHTPLQMSGSHAGI